MFNQILIVGLLTIVTAIPVTPQASTKNGVLVLTDTNFDSTIKRNEFVLVMFYAPWCQYSRAALPEYEQAAQELARSGSMAKLAKVDGSEHRMLAEKYGIKYIPDFRLFKRGKEDSVYEWAAKRKDFVTWMEMKVAQG